MVNKQDFINAINLNIDMVRGDTMAYNFQLAGLGSREAYEALFATLAVAEHYEDEPIFIVTTGNGIELEEYDEDTDTALFSVYIAPNQTKTLDVNRYYYDMQIDDETDVITLLRGRLNLVYDIAD